MTHFKRFPLVSLLALGMALPALAQTPPAPKGAATSASGPQATADRTPDVIVVTANKREESVQDIAVAVTAITSQERDQIGLTSVQDYTNFAPGLTYSTGTDRLGMRGVTRTSNNFGIRSGISNYVDGVYYSSAIPAGRAPIFVDRVEVVRGPQGTLYGRDSIGGALNLISKKPSDTFEAQINIGDDNFDHRKFEARIAGPITDWLRYSLAGSREAQDRGYFTNYSGLESEGGRTDEYYIEGQLAGNITEKFDWWIKANRLEWTRKGAPGARTNVDAPYPYDTRYYTSTSDIAPNAWYGLTDPNHLQLGSQTTNPSITDRDGFNTDHTDFAHLRPTDEYAASATYHAPGFDIKYLGGYVYYNYDLIQDHDGSPITQYTRNNETIFTQRESDYMENRGWFSNEINFISTGNGPLQWTAGLYAYQENYEQTVFVNQLHDPGGPVYRFNDLNDWLGVGGPLLGAPAPGLAPVLPTGMGHNPNSGATVPGASLVFFTDNEAVNNAYGAFLQGDYSFNDHWKLTAGIRYSKDYMRGREYARVVNHYVVEDALEQGYIAGYAPLIGAGAAAAVVPGIIPARIDVTDQLGGPDPTTVTTANPCGYAGKGILNTNVTTANGAIDPGTGACASNDRSRFGIYTDPVTGNAYRDIGANWGAVTGVLGLDWTPDSDTLVYGKYNRGYKPGGIGAAEVYGILLPTPYTDKETMDALEFGLKREWRQLNLTTNLVGFFYNYKNYQVPNTVVPPDPGPGAVRPAPYTAYVNIPKTQTTGFELETTWRPIEDLRFLFNYGWTNPEIKKAPPLVSSLDPYALDPQAKPFGAPAATGEQGQDVSGYILPESPKNKIAVNGLYTFNMQDGSKIDTSLSYFWQDISYTSIFNSSYTRVPSWDQWDGRISWTSADQHFTIIGFGRNLLNERGYDSRGAGLVEGTNKIVPPTQCYTSAATTPPLGGVQAESCYQLNSTYRPPRTYGIELQFRY
jgi:iron complex outermembrane receptor protein